MYTIYTLILLLIASGCKKLVEVDAPTTSINENVVFSTDQTAIAVLTDLFASKLGNINSQLTSISLLGGLSSDELKVDESVTDLRYLTHYQNQLSSLSNNGLSDIWSSCYSGIYVTNSAIAALNSSTTLTPSIKSQLEGEAKFTRAFFYFYLVNLYGDVPLNLTTNYQQNSVRPRSKVEEVYKQIILDLKDAQQLLNVEYKNAKMENVSERTRPNKMAATALLSRVYLFSGNNESAEAEASSVIANKMLYDIVGIDEVFLKNSRETIWSLQPIQDGFNSNTTEGQFFILNSDNFPSNDHPVYLQETLVESFVTNDLRRSWIGTYLPTGGSKGFSFPFKYKIGFEDMPVAEYSVVLRLAEVYLIRAEARARLGNLAGSREDLNIIRNRAGLDGILTSNSESLINAIIAERKLELFSEWGHRWVDLKRIGKASEVLSEVKGTNWQPYDVFYPIPQMELDGNPGIRGHQNTGY